MSEHALLLLGIGEGAAIILLLVTLLALTEYGRRETRDWAACFEKSCLEHSDELRLAAGTLVEVAQSMRLNRRETTEVIKRIETEVPSRTAAEVDKKIAERAKNGGHH